jgi:hypothetical protein
MTREDLERLAQRRAQLLAEAEALEDRVDFSQSARWQLELIVREINSLDVRLAAARQSPAA